MIPCRDGQSQGVSLNKNTPWLINLIKGDKNVNKTNDCHMG